MPKKELSLKNIPATKASCKYAPIVSLSEEDKKEVELTSDVPKSKLRSKITPQTLSKKLLVDRILVKANARGANIAMSV